MPLPPLVTAQPRHLWGRELLPTPYRRSKGWGRVAPTAFWETPHPRSAPLPTHPPSAPRQNTPFGELVGVPVLLHHKLGDLDGQRAKLMGGEAVLAQHHAVGPGGTGKGGRAEKVSSGLSFPLSGPLWAGTPQSMHCLEAWLWAMLGWAQVSACSKSY